MSTQQESSKLIELKLIQIIAEKSEMHISLENVDTELEMRDFGVTSIDFIRIVIAIEIEFSFEFGDGNLDYNRFNNIKSLVSYIESKITNIS